MRQRAGEPGRERRAGGRGRRSQARGRSPWRPARPSAARRLTVDDNGPGVAGRARANGSSIPTSPARSTAPGWAWRSCARSSSTTAATSASTIEPSPLGGARFVVTLADRGGSAIDRPASRSSGRPPASMIRSAERGRGRAGEPRLQAAAAHPGAQHAGVVDGQRRRVERLLAAVGQRQPGRRPSGSMRAARATSGVSSTSQVGEPLLVQPQHVARPSGGRRQPIEPAKQGALQALVRDLGALVDEAPLAIDADPRLPDLRPARRPVRRPRRAIRVQPKARALRRAASARLWCAASLS